MQGQTRRQQQQGFTLVEMLVAMASIAIAVAGSALLISSSTEQFRRSARLNELNQLVESDIAAVRRANDRMVCASSTCTIFAGDPTRANYFPITASTAFCLNLNSPERNRNCLTDAQRTIRNFVWDPGTDANPAGGGLCRSTTSDGGFAFQLNSLLSAAAPLNARLNRVMDRTIDPNGQLYTLTYTEAGTGRYLRQISLVPAIFSWCPNDVPNA
jgi:prepilin-type N-terminal cleavage/methylation domain-containing protein